MADRAINFTEPMVAAIEREIEQPGTGKTKTRRGLNISGHRTFTEFGVSDTAGYDWHFRDREKRWHDLRDHELKARLPWQVGDQLWVRQSYYQYGHWEPIPGRLTAKGRRQKWAFVPDRPDVLYEAPAEFRRGRHHKDSSTPAWHKRLGRFMPRQYSRLTLTVTNVRVERLQSISEEDAAKEGRAPCKHCGDSGWINSSADGGWQCDAWGCGEPDTIWYRELWDHINGPGSWEKNPWVVAITFTAETRNVDAGRMK
jgi:hypothetical protein